MSDSAWVNQTIAVVAGVVVGYFTAGTAGYATYAAIAGMATYAVTGTVLNYVGGVNRPKSSGMARPTAAFGRKGDNSVKDAASQGLNVNSASEAVVIPVAFGRCLINGNLTRYAVSTYRSVPIVERIQRDPSTVAYNIAKDAYKRNPGQVDHILDDQAKKQNQGQQGGKGGGSSNSSPPPSKQYSDSEKVAAYTQYLLEKDASGKSSLPKEYDEFTTGYKYYLSWELAICMGLVNALFSVRVYPGEYFAVSRYEAEAIIADETVLNGSGGEQGGMIRFYRGSNNQNRNYADPYGPNPYANNVFGNYRGVAFATFCDYYMGQQPGPLSYSFEVGRYPLCLGVDGLPVPGLHIKGTNPAEQSFWDANPAAILWEVFTNKRWGKGLDPALLDVDSFVSASQFFADEEIGMSFTMDTETLITDVVEQIRSHVQTVVIWSGGKLYCRCLMDRSTAYTPMITVTSDSVTDVSLARPAWPSCPNELRATYTDVSINYHEAVVVMQDLAGISTQGRINSSQVKLPCFSNRLTCEKAVKRMLGEVSYPQATLSYKTNRFDTRLTPGDFIRFVWTEWSEGPVTSYWRVVEISDKDQDAGGVTVRLVEDLYATATEGIPDTFEIPVPAYEGMTLNSDSDLYLGDNPSGPFTDAIQTLDVVEMPISLTDSDRIMAIFCQRSDPRCEGVKIYWRVAETEDWFFLGQISPWAITGKIIGVMEPGPVTTRQCNVEIQLDNPDEVGRFLEFCSTCPTSEDPIDMVAGSDTNMMRVDNELMLVAQAEAGSFPGYVKLKAVIRGQYGTTADYHYEGAPCDFVYQFIPRVHTLRHDQMPLNTLLEIQAVPFDRRGVEGTPVIIERTLINRARQPLPIENWSVEIAGSDWAGTFRPRFHNRGQDFVGELEASLNTLTAAVPDGYEWFIMPLDISELPLLDTPAKLTITFTPDDGNTPQAGLADFTYSVPFGTESLYLYTAFEGVISEPTHLTAP